MTIGVEEGILLAIVLSLLRHVRHSYRPHTMVLAPNATGRWTLVPVTPGAQTEPGLIIYRFGADLFYANDHRFTDEVRSLVEHAPTPVRWFIVDADAITDIDYSARSAPLRRLARLRARRERPRHGRAAEKCDERTALQRRDHSITSSAMASSPGGKLRPNALAVLRLITNSNLIDCMTGRSAGFSPLRIRPVYTPVWRYAPVMLVP